MGIGTNIGIEIWMGIDKGTDFGTYTVNRMGIVMRVGIMFGMWIGIRNRIGIGVRNRWEFRWHWYWYCSGE